MRNILLVGITGAGKSATGTLLCQPDGVFASSDGSMSCTKDGETIVSKTNNIKVTDTMGFLDTNDSAEVTKLKITSALADVKEGVHCIMFFAEFGRISEPEYLAFRLMVENIFGEQCKDHLVFVLTHVTKAKYVTDEAARQQYVKEQLNYRPTNGKNLFKNMYEMCGGRIVFVNNPPVDEDDQALENSYEAQRMASRVNLFKFIDALDQSKVYLPEVARKVQEEYEMKLKELEAKAKQEQDERARLEAQKAVDAYKQSAEAKKMELMQRQIEDITAAKNKELAEMRDMMMQMSKMLGENKRSRGLCSLQ